MQRRSSQSVLFNPARPGRTLPGACAVGLLLIDVLLVGGCVQYHAGRLGDPDLGINRVNDIHALEKFPDNPAAQLAIIRAIDDESWAIQIFAASALRKIDIADEKLKVAACNSLVQLLDNENSGPVCVRSGNRYTLYSLSSPNKIARKRLVQLTGEDFGFDKDRWREYLNSHR